MKLLLMVCILLLGVSACNPKKQEFKKLLAHWLNRDINFPSNLPVKICGKDTLILTTTKYKILNYIDTSGCIPCKLDLYEWKTLQKEAEAKQLDVTFTFIAYVHDYNELETLQRINRLNIPCIYDTCGMFQKLNKIPNDRNFKTFLLDSNNRVLLVGNPVKNDRLRQLYLKKIQE